MALRATAADRTAGRRRVPQRARNLNCLRYVGAEVWPRAGSVELQTKQVDLFCVRIEKLRGQTEEQTKQESEQRAGKRKRVVASVG